MGRLERHLDEDLIDRMDAGWSPSQRTTPAKKAKPAREASSYRAARRNAAKGTVWRGVVAKQLGGIESGDRVWNGLQYVGAVRINRSKKWDGVPLTKPYGFPYVNR